MNRDGYIFTKPFTVEKIEKLRDMTEVNQLVKFYTWESNLIQEGHIRKEHIGYIEEKYPHIFKLSDGKSYSWADYMLGFVY